MSWLTISANTSSRCEETDAEPGATASGPAGPWLILDVGQRKTFAMDISELSKRAMEIRTRFAEFEQAKFRREWTKEEVMQGFVVDVGDLMKLVMAKSGVRQVEDVD